jgi:hypothetical protein
LPSVPATIPTGGPLAGSAKSLTWPVVVRRPTFSARNSVNHILPSGALATPFGRLPGVGAEILGSAHP